MIALFNAVPFAAGYTLPMDDSRPYSLLAADDTCARFKVQGAMTASELLAAAGCSKNSAARIFATQRLGRDACALAEAGIPSGMPASIDARVPEDAMTPGAITASVQALSHDAALADGDVVVLEFAHGNDRHPVSSTPAAILFEDRFVLAADKPAGLLVHSDGTGAETLTARVQGHLQQNGVHATAQAVQRLDFETTGIVLFSLTEEFQPAIDRLVEAGGMRKRYLAVVAGEFPAGERVISQPIGRDRHDAKAMRISASGKPAITRAARIGSAQVCSLLLVELVTGRRHQIRVHLAAMGFPIIGDALYGGAPCELGLMLHAFEESFEHPVTGKAVDIRSPWPPRFMRWFPEPPAFAR